MLCLRWTSWAVMSCAFVKRGLLHKQLPTFIDTLGHHEGSAALLTEFATGVRGNHMAAFPTVQWNRLVLMTGGGQGQWNDTCDGTLCACLHIRA